MMKHTFYISSVCLLPLTFLYFLANRLPAAPRITDFKLGSRVVVKTSQASVNHTCCAEGYPSMDINWTVNGTTKRCAHTWTSTLLSQSHATGLVKSCCVLTTTALDFQQPGAVPLQCSAALNFDADLCHRDPFLHLINETGVFADPEPCDDIVGQVARKEGRIEVISKPNALALHAICKLLRECGTININHWQILSFQ